MLRKPGDTHLAVVLLSGGMDSCVAVAIARQSCELALMHVSYGQRTEERERRAFSDIVRHYGVHRTLATRLDHLKVIGGSALTDPSRDAVEARRPGSSVPDTYVPFRNTHLLAMAVSCAEVLGARSVYIGAVQEDSSGYPDCREEYYDAFNRLLRVGTRPETRLEVKTPRFLQHELLFDQRIENVFRQPHRRDHVGRERLAVHLFVVFFGVVERALILAE